MSIPTDQPVYVIIVTYNAKPWLNECLSSIFKSHWPVKVIVVDNASSDGTLDMIKLSFENVMCISNRTNLGFGQANNIGISVAIDAGAEYIFLLNQDTSVEPETIPNLKIACDSGPAHIVSPLHFNGRKTDYDQGFRNFILKDHSSATLEHWKNGFDKNVVPVSFVNAAAWIFKKDVVKKIGGFAPLFFHYGEDRDFVNRLHYFKFQIGVLPAARIFHYRESRDMDVKNWHSGKMIKYYYVGWLSRVTDINASVMSGFLAGWVWSLKEMIMLTLKGMFSAPFLMFAVFYKILISMPKVISHRKAVERPSVYQFLSCESE